MLAELAGFVPLCGPIGWIAGQAIEGAPLGYAYTCSAVAASKHNTATTFISMLYCDHHLITEKHKGFSTNVKLSQDCAPLTSTATKSSTEYPGTNYFM